MKDWVAWHAGYDDPSSSLTARLHDVQQRLTTAVHDAPGGPVSLLSLCAGQGQDVSGALAGHPRRDDVTAVLVESDPRNVEQARRRVAAAGLARVQVRQADAALVRSFADALPADVVMLCGIFGNVSDADIRRTVLAAPTLCASNATVIWTRHRRPPDLTPLIRRWFDQAGFDEVAFDALGTDALTGVGVHHLREPSSSAPPDEPLFTFIR